MCVHVCMCCWVPQQSRLLSSIFTIKQQDRPLLKNHDSSPTHRSKPLCGRKPLTPFPVWPSKGMRNRPGFEVGFLFGNGSLCFLGSLISFSAEHKDPSGNAFSFLSPADYVLPAGPALTVHSFAGPSRPPGKPSPLCQEMWLGQLPVEIPPGGGQEGRQGGCRELLHSRVV